MNNISKLGEDIEKRLQGIENTQDEYNKIIVELNTRINTLERTLDNTHKTFNLLLENINSKNDKINKNGGKFINSDSSDSSDSDSDSSYENMKKSKKNKKNRNNIRTKNNLNSSGRRVF
jgi:uncharacterized coiled-coil protein SlyX